MHSILPNSLAEVDVIWLNGVLQGNHPGVKISRMDAQTIVHGAATKVCFKLAFERNVDPRLGDTVWLKAGWEPHSEWLTGTSRIYAKEAWFYRDLKSRIAVNAPLALYADFDDRGRGIVLLEDL